MIETAYQLSRTDDTAIERILFDDNLHYIHMVFPTGEGMPVHNANANVYMTVVRGTLSIALGEQDVHVYEAGTMIKIPNGTLMNAKNLHEPTLELIIVKAPPPAAT